MMMRTSLSLTILLGLAFMTVALVGPAAADLGCDDVDFSTAGDLGGSNPFLATCAIAADCTAVGGIDCTNGVCFCTSGPLAPFCACAAAPAPPRSVPAMSNSALLGVVLLLLAMGILRLRPSARLSRRRG